MGKKKDRKTKIVFTGGHAATTALATFEEVVKRGNNWQIFWLGAEQAFEGKRVPTLESQVFSKMDIEFFPIISGRIQRKFSLWTIPSLLKIPFGFIHALTLLIKIRPEVVLSFGGFTAFPVVFAGWLLRVPVILHEQTAAAGLANKLSAPFVKRVALARKESVRHFPENKVVVTGNPVLSQVTEIKAKKTLSSPPTLFVTCGSRGSERINNLVGEVLEELLKKVTVIHQTGKIDFERFKKIKEKLPKNIAERYEVYSVIDPMQMDGVYKRADVVLARAGANTVSEVMIIGRPTILIPIPWSRLNEQVKNARFAERQGIAKILLEEKATPKTLLAEVDNIIKDWGKISQNIQGKKSPDKDASKKLVDLIEKHLK